MTSKAYVSFINEVLKNSTLSVNELAEELGISRNNFYLWAKGTHAPRKKHLNKIAEICGYQITFELNDELTFTKGDAVNMQAEKIIANQLDQIDELKQRIAQLERGEITHHPHPEAFNVVADNLENITKQWNWAFYNNEAKPMSITRDGTIRAINPALEKAIGFTENEVRNKSILDLVHREDRKAVAKELYKKDRNVTVRVKKKNGINKYCTMRVNAKEWGVNNMKYSVGFLSCVEKGCDECKDEKN